MILYSSKDGLPHTIVNSVVIDKKGIVWTGTRYGISSYDGFSWKTFTKADGLSLSLLTK